MTRTTPLNSEPPRHEWPALVNQAIEYIRAGDIFQVNLARMLSMGVTGSPRSFATAALAEPQSTYGALMEWPDQDRTIVSMSPELFLHVDAAGSIRSCPIKGTLPSDQPAERLISSEKDAAELAMIVDLMRNDLGRVCCPGTVQVVCPRRIESHRTLHHSVGEVSGQLQSGTSLRDILRATFPPGSITGAPKVRAMQIASELEAVPRGPYCGAIALLGQGDAMTLSVAIRTAVIEQRVLRYGVGCGIVADSVAERELAESETKAAVLASAISPHDAVASVAAEVLQSHA